jgi:hypothetical protein
MQVLVQDYKNYLSTWISAFPDLETLTVSAAKELPRDLNEFLLSLQTKVHKLSHFLGSSGNGSFENGKWTLARS